jgi:hypothetical protein
MTESSTGPVTRSTSRQAVASANGETVPRTSDRTVATWLGFLRRGAPPSPSPNPGLSPKSTIGPSPGPATGPSPGQAIEPSPQVWSLSGSYTVHRQPRCPDPSTDPAAWEPAQPVQAAHTGLALPPKVSTFGGTEPYHSSRASNSARRTCPPPEPSRSSSSRVETIQPHLQAKGLSAVVAARLCRNM